MPNSFTSASRLLKKPQVRSLGWITGSFRTPSSVNSCLMPAPLSRGIFNQPKGYKRPLFDEIDKHAIREGAIAGAPLGLVMGLDYAAKTGSPLLGISVGLLTGCAVGTGGIATGIFMTKHSRKFAQAAVALTALSTVLAMSSTPTQKTDTTNSDKELVTTTSKNSP